MAYALGKMHLFFLGTLKLLLCFLFAIYVNIMNMLLIIEPSKTLFIIFLFKIILSFTILFVIF